MKQFLINEQDLRYFLSKVIMDRMANKRKISSIELMEVYQKEDFNDYVCDCKNKDKHYAKEVLDKEIKTLKWLDTGLEALEKRLTDQLEKATTE